MSDKKIRLSDIADELGITASTVSRAMQDHPRISDATKKAVAEKAEELNYQYNNIAAALRKGKSNLLGILVPTADRNFFSSIIRGVEELANEIDYNVIICQSYDSFEKEKKNINALLEAQVDGILASIAMETSDYSHYKKVISKNIPLIFYDRMDPSINTSSVVINDYLGAYKAVDHLIEQGCKRIAHFAGQQHINIYKERLRGYKDALEAHGIPLEDELIINSKLKIDSGSNDIKNLLELAHPPDAIFSASDYAAIGAMQVLVERKIKVPDEIAVVGFSNESFTSLVTPSLTTIDQQTNMMGRTAAELFYQHIKSKDNNIEPQKKVLEPKLIIRESSLRK